MEFKEKLPMNANRFFSIFDVFQSSFIKKKQYQKTRITKRIIHQYRSKLDQI